MRFASVYKDFANADDFVSFIKDLDDAGEGPPQQGDRHSTR